MAHLLLWQSPERAEENEMLPPSEWVYQGIHLGGEGRGGEGRGGEHRLELGEYLAIKVN